MAAPSPALVRTIRVVDTMSEWAGNLFAWLIIPMVLGLTWEVIARYGFNAPTIWAFDATYMLYGSHFMLGAGYALLKGAHIRTDFLYEKYSDRTKGIIDALAYILFFFPSMIMILLSSIDDAAHSWRIGELSEQTAWRPPLYPFKTVIPLAAALLMVQGIAETLKALYAARTGTWIHKGEGIQV